MRNSRFISSFLVFRLRRHQAFVGSMIELSRNFNPPFISPELNSQCFFLVKRLVGHNYSVIVFEREKFRARVAGGNDFNWTALIHPDTPLSDIEVVRSPIGSVSSA